MIRRKLNVAEGDAYNRALVDRSKNAIKGMGFFKDVDITNVPGAAPDRTNLLVHVTEQPTGQLNFSAGYSTIDKLITDVGISQSNFRGRGQDVRARVELGSISQQASVSFTEPHWLNRDLQAGFDLFTQRYNFTEQASYISTSTGGTVRVAFPLTSNSLLTTRYTLHTDERHRRSFLCIPGQELVSVVLCTEAGSYITSLVGYSLGLDNPQRREPFHAWLFHRPFAGSGWFWRIGALFAHPGKRWLVAWVQQGLHLQLYRQGWLY